MASFRIFGGADATTQVLTSLLHAERAIAASLGPFGRAALFGLDHGVGFATSGHIIARELPQNDGIEGTAPRLLKEALFSFESANLDGTARLALLTIAMFRRSVLELQTGHAPQHLAEAMKRLIPAVTSWIEAEQVEVPQLHQVGVATGLSQDHALTLANLVREIGRYGVVDVQEGNDAGLIVERSQGYRFDGIAIGEPSLKDLANPSVLVADEIISEFGILANVLEGFANKRKALVIVARDITGNALATLRRNQQAQIVTVAAFKPKDSGSNAVNALEDLSVMTGAELIAENRGRTITTVRPAMLGRARSVSIKDGAVNFIDPAGDGNTIGAHQDLLRSDAKRVRYLAFDREHLERRAAKLTGGLCVIQMRSATALETDRQIKDFRAATRMMQSAIVDGATLGGNSVYQKLESLALKSFSQPLDAAAARILSAGFKIIPFHLARNASASMTALSGNDHGVQDPVMLTRSAVQQAISLTTALFSAAVVITR